MMKSFFKKLAFVMALAMVVSLAAPAGSALAAESLNVTVQGTKDAITEYTLAKVGDTVDFQFWKAPANWATDYKWESSNEAVATVDKAGIVTAVAEGTADITITVLGTYVGKVALTVGEKAVEVEPTVAPTVEPTVAPTVAPAVVEHKIVQKTDKLAEIIFTGAHNYATTDIELYRIFDGGFTSVWPIKEIKATDTGFTIQPYVAFSDGDKYLIKIGSEDEGCELKTVIANPNRIEVSYKSNGTANKAYYAEDAEYPVEFDVNFFYNDINLNDVYKKDAQMTYEVISTTDAESIYLDEYEGKLFFYKTGVAVNVLAKYTYYDAEGKEVVVPFEIPGIVSENVPEYKVEGVIDWCIVKEGTAADKINWNTKNIKANDDANATYKLVLLIQDSYGNKVVTDGTYATKDNKYKSATDGDYNFAKEGYYVSYDSADVAKMLVGDLDATLTTYTEATVPVIIGLNKSGKEGGDFVKNIHAVPVVVQKARAINRVEINKSSVNVTTDGDFVTESVEIKVYDNYNELWTADVELAVSTNIDGVTVGSTATFKGGDKATFKFDGKDLLAQTDKNSVKVTFKANGKSDDITVNLKKPRYKDNAIQITSYSLDATDIDQKLKNSDKGTVVKNTVTLYQLSNGLKVGKESNIEILTKATLTKAETSQGDRYLAVYDTENKLVTATGTGSKLAVVNNNDGTFGVVVATATASGTVMQYAPEGTYTVKVVEVNGFNSKNEARFTTKYTDTFKVTNTSNKLSDVKQEETKSVSADILSVVKDTISVKLGGKAWDYGTDDIVKVEGRYNASAGYVIITSITFNVPLDGASDATGYEVKVAVNKSVEVPNFDGQVVNGVFKLD